VPFDNVFNPTKAKGFSFLHHKPREDNRTVLKFHTTRRFFDQRAIGPTAREFGLQGACNVGPRRWLSHSLGSRTGIRSLRGRADGIERVAGFDPVSSMAEVDAREADDKDGVRITGRYGWATSTACTPGTKCSAAVLTTIRFGFGRWIFEAVV